jgi:hypothetical protein
MTWQETPVLKKEDIMNEDKRIEATMDTHKPARPLKWFKDKQGNTWLCDKNIDFNGDLEAQGCWRCEEIAFPYGGR